VRKAIPVGRAWKSFRPDQKPKKKNKWEPWPAAEPVATPTPEKTEVAPPKWTPMTLAQGPLAESMVRKEFVLLTGPAGTSKTFMAALTAMRWLSAGLVEKVYLVRPAVEAGEKIGYLPGSAEMKLKPYLMPFYEALESMGYDHKSLTKEGQIEIVPVGFARGRTFNGAVVLDESQNCSQSQLAMVLGRLGKDGRMVVTGDMAQADVKGGCDLYWLAEKIGEMGDPTVKAYHLSEGFDVRHRLVPKFSAMFKRSV